MEETRHCVVLSQYNYMNVVSLSNYLHAPFPILMMTQSGATPMQPGRGGPMACSESSQQKMGSRRLRVCALRQAMAQKVPSAVSASRKSSPVTQESCEDVGVLKTLHWLSSLCPLSCVQAEQGHPEAPVPSPLPKPLNVTPTPEGHHIK